MWPKTLVLFCACALTQATTVFSQSPGVRNGHSMAYSHSDKAVLVFGGANESAVLGDTWLLRAGKWKLITGSGPDKRTFAAMVKVKDYILLFGGNSVLFGSEINRPILFGDTWKYQHGIWRKLTLSKSPPARAEAGIAYDEVRNRVVLFGGYELDSITHRPVRLRDTWEFDGLEWDKKSDAGPSARSGCAMAYDSHKKKTILFGGNISATKANDYNGPLWSWDGAHWENLNSQDSIVYNTCLAYDSKSRTMLRFGGWNGQSRIDETAALVENKWQKLSSSSSPSGRNHSSLVYDQRHEAFILFGGHDGAIVYGDVWSWKSSCWNLIHRTEPVQRVINGH